MYEQGQSGNGYGGPVMNRMPPPMATSAPTPQRSGVGDVARSLSNDVDMLLNVVAGLEERLSGVLAPTGPDSVGKEAGAIHGTQLVSALADIDGRVNVAIRRLHDITSRVDL